jgi:hypothetical protein
MVGHVNKTIIVYDRETCCAGFHMCYSINVGDGHQPRGAGSKSEVPLSKRSDWINRNLEREARKRATREERERQERERELEAARERLRRKLQEK